MNERPQSLISIPQFEEITKFESAKLPKKSSSHLESVNYEVVSKLKGTCNKIQCELNDEISKQISRSEENNKTEMICSEENTQIEMMRMLKDMHQLVLEIHGRVTKIEEHVVTEGMREVTKVENEIDNKDQVCNVPSMENLNSVKLETKKVKLEETKPKPKIVIEEELVLKRVEKTAKEKEIIQKQIESKFILFDACSKDELENMNDAFCPVTFEAGTSIAVQGEIGNYFYVIEKGSFDVFVDNEKVSQLQAPGSFGDCSLLFCCAHTATIQAREDCKLWCIHQWKFRNVTGSYKMSRLKLRSDYIRNVKIGGKILGEVLEPSDIENIAFITKFKSFKSGEVIIKEGEIGSVFYIIEEGIVDVYRKDCVDKPVNVLTKSSFFGERALFFDDVRQATCIAKSDVKCLTLDRKDFVRMFSSFQHLLDKSWRKEEGDGLFVDFGKRDVLNLDMDTTCFELTDFEYVRNLGAGTFAKIQLVKLRTGFSKHMSLKSNMMKSQSTRGFGIATTRSSLTTQNSWINKMNRGDLDTFAVKVINKAKIYDDHMKHRIKSEKEIMSQLNNPFIVRCFQEIQDDENVYLLLEPMLGGDLYKLLSTKRCFPESWCRFYTASILKAFEDIHSKRIAYRDLKLENVVLNEEGYIKLTDFGLAKKTHGEKSWTVCGTPDYLSPELILNEGHDHAVDYWALGILIYEMIVGQSPFSDQSEINRYNRIISGRFVVPENICPILLNLIRSLLERNQSHRLGRTYGGAKKVMNHGWFASFDWRALEEGTMDPPYINLGPPSDTKPNGRRHKFPIRLMSWQPKNWFG